MSCFSYYVLCFFSYKIRDQEDRAGSAQREAVGTWDCREGASAGERGRVINMVQIFIHM
jgi:hypothetical protein